MHAEAGAKYEIAAAEAKHADDPAKGLAELKQQKAFWQFYGTHEKGSDKVKQMDERVANKIEALLLDREKRLENTSTAKLTDAFKLLAIENGKPEGPAWSSIVERARHKVGADTLQQDAAAKRREARGARVTSLLQVTLCINFATSLSRSQHKFHSLRAKDG